MKNFLIGVLIMVVIISITAAARSYKQLEELQTSYRRLQLQIITTNTPTQLINK